MSQTELEYEVTRWMKINPRDVLESEPAYIARAVAEFKEEQRQEFIQDIEESQDILELLARYQ